jgi:hypothetical protein
MFSSLPIVPDRQVIRQSNRPEVGRTLVPSPPPRGQVTAWRRDIHFDPATLRAGDRIALLTITGNIISVTDRVETYITADVVCDCGTVVKAYKITGNRWQGLSCGCHVAWSPVAARRGAYREVA